MSSTPLKIGENRSGSGGKLRRKSPVPVLAYDQQQEIIIALQYLTERIEVLEQEVLTKKPSPVSFGYYI